MNTIFYNKFKRIVGSSVFIYCYMSSGYAKEDNSVEWVPEEFRSMIQQRTVKSMDVYLGKNWLGVHDVEYAMALSGVRFLNPAVLVNAICQQAEIKESAMAGILDSLSGELDNHSAEQCHDRDVTKCPITGVDNKAAVVVDGHRSRIRIALSPDFYTAVAKTQANVQAFIPPSSEQKISWVQGVKANVSGNSNEPTTYNIRGNALVAKGEQFIDGGWSLYSYSNKEPMVAMDQFVWNAEQQGKLFSLGLHDGARSSLNAPWLFRTISSNNMYGVSVGTSSHTKLNKANSTSTPIDVYLPSDGIVEVYRDERLLSTQSFSVGLHLLDTSDFPFGIYELETRVIIGSTTTNVTRRLFSKSSSLPQDLTGDFFVNIGSHAIFRDDSVLPDSGNIGGAVGWVGLIDDVHALKLGGQFFSDQKNIEVGILGNWPIKYDFAFALEPKRIGNVMSLSHQFGKASYYVNGTFFWYDSMMEDRVQTSGDSAYVGATYSLFDSHSLGYRYGYQELYQTKSADGRTINYDNKKSISHSLSHATSFRMSKDLRLMFITRYDKANKDNLLSFNTMLTFFEPSIGSATLNNYLTKAPHSSMSSVTGVNLARSLHKSEWYNSADINIGASMSDTQNSANINGAFQTDRLNSSLAIFNQNGEYGSIWGYYGALESQVVGTDDEVYLGVSRQSDKRERAVLLVDLMDTPDNDIYHVVVNNREYPARGRDVTPLQLDAYHTYSVRLREPSNKYKLLHVVGENKDVTLYPGNVSRIKFSIENDVVLFGQLVDQQGIPLTQGLIVGRTPAQLEPSGRFEVRVSSLTKNLLVRTGNRNCVAPLSAPLRQQKLPYHSIGKLMCSERSDTDVKELFSEAKGSDWVDWFAIEIPMGDTITKVH